MDDILMKIVKKIVETAKPEKIILFGSRAKDKNNKQSDYDLCVLKEGVIDKGKLSQMIYRGLFGVGAAVDIIVETPEKFNELKDKWFLIYHEVAKSGRLVYEK